MITPEFLHYLAAGIAVALGSIGAGIGQGIGAFSGVSSMSRQPTGNDQIFRTMIIGLAFIETGALFTLVMTLLIMFGTATITMPIALAEFGIAISIGIAAISISIASSMAVKSSCQSISRQPFIAQKIITFMLLAQSIIEAPIVFTLIVSLIVKTGLTETTSIYEGLKYLAACLSIGLGCIGPSCGQGIYSNSSCNAVGLNKDAYNKIFTFSLINQAVIETPLIFSMLISILLLTIAIPANSPLSSSIGFIMAALTASIGSLGTPIAAGYVGAKSCHQLALEPKSYSALFKNTILAQAFIESSVIYCLLIALFLVMKTY